MDVVQPPLVVSAPADGAAGTGAEPPIRLVHRLEYGMLRLAEWVARRVPIGWSTATGAVLAGAVGPWLRQHRRALANLAVAFPERSEAERRAIARAMWANMGRIFAETLILDRIVAEPDRLEIEDRARWQSLLAAPGPAIGCTLHMGNWELAIWPFTLLGREPAGVYKPLDNPLIDAWLARTRRTLFIGGLLAKGLGEDARSGQRTARQMIDLARKGRFIGFVSDHVDRRGTPIPFLGRTARFTTAPAMIARHVGAKVWLGRCVRVGRESRFRWEPRLLDVPRTGDKAADAAALTAAIFAVFEAWVRDAPEQWMWWNTRFVSPGELAAAVPVEGLAPAEQPT